MRAVALVLAAGEGRRLGGPKALLRAGGQTFLESSLRALSRPGLSGLVVEVGHEASRVRDALPPSWGAAVVENAAHRQGMLSSILAGLEAAEAMGAEAVLVHPVDHPLVEPETVDRVLEALARGAVVAVPSHGGRRGHPGGFARAAWPALRAALPERGARAVLADHPEWVVHVPGGPGCVCGFNVPGDLRRLQSPR